LEVLVIKKKEKDKKIFMSIQIVKWVDYEIVKLNLDK